VSRSVTEIYKICAPNRHLV